MRREGFGQLNLNTSKSNILFIPYRQAMNKQNIILDFENILNTYKHQVPSKSLEVPKLRGWVPLFKDSVLSDKSAYLIGKIMGDGNLDRSFTCRFVGQFEDLNELRELIIENYLIKKTSITLRPKKAKGFSYLLQINDSLFGRFLYALGAPIGNKTKTEFLIPNWISSSKHSKKHFLQAIFDDELSTIKIKRKKYIREATFKMAKIEKYQENLVELLSQIKGLTESLSVKCSKISGPYFEDIQKDGNKTFSQCFRILGNKENMMNFSKNIGFGLNQNKIKELENCMCYIKSAEKRIRIQVLH